MSAGRSVAEQQLDLVRPGHSELVEAIDVCRQLHEGGNARVTGELRVLNDPAPVRIPQKEVREAHELIVGEGRLIDHDRVIRQQCFVGERDGTGKGFGIRGGGLGNLDDRAAEAFAVSLESSAFVHATQASGTFQGEIYRILDRIDTTELRVDGAHPGELALGGGLEVARTPDEPTLALDVSHDAFPLPTIAGASDTTQPGCAVVADTSTRPHRTREPASASRCLPGTMQSRTSRRAHTRSARLEA